MGLFSGIDSFTQFLGDTQEDPKAVQKQRNPLYAKKGEKGVHPLLAQSMGQKLPVGPLQRMAKQRNQPKPFGVDPQQSKMKGASPLSTLLDGDHTMMSKEQMISSPYSKHFPNASQGVFSATQNQDDTLAQFGIDTPERQRHFMAQMAHESGGFKHMEELGGDDRANRMYGPDTKVGKNLGNTQPGDGAAFKGRGIIQLTGRWNYQDMSNKLGIDLVNNPGMASDPDIAWKIAAQFWNDRGLNDLADKGDLRGITKAINGGYNGLKDRQSWYDKLGR